MQKWYMHIKELDHEELSSDFLYLDLENKLQMLPI